MKVKYVSIFAILLVLLSGTPLFSGGTMNHANARYATDTQTQANANECEGDSNCAINSPQTQGDGSASSPTSLQISVPQKELQGPDSPDSRILATIQVSNFVICPVGFEAICPEEADFETKITSEDPFATFDPATFPGGNRITPEGSTLVSVLVSPPELARPGMFTIYSVSQTPPPTPEGLILLQSQDQECATDSPLLIGFGFEVTCEFSNEYREAPTP